MSHDHKGIESLLLPYLVLLGGTLLLSRQERNIFCEVVICPSTQSIEMYCVKGFITIYYYRTLSLSKQLIPLNNRQLYKNFILHLTRRLGKT